MSINNNKVALHLYLNNPYGLLAAYIPNYTVNVVDGAGARSPIKPLVEQTVSSFTASPQPVETPVNNNSEEPTPKRKRKKKKVQIRNPIEEEEETDEISAVRECNINDIKVELGDEFATTSDKKGNAFANHTPPLPHIFSNRGNGVQSRNSGRSPYFLDSPRSPNPTSDGDVCCNTERANRDIASSLSGGSPALGFTWSIRSDYKRSRVIIPKKPTPKTILERLCGSKSPDPIGVVKVKKPPTVDFPYDVHRAILADRTQKKMSERLSEWLDHYNEVSNRQQEYLQKIHHLRRGIQNQDENNIISTIDKMRSNDKVRTRRKYPLYTMCRMENSPVNQGPAAFPNRQSFFHSDDKKISPRARLEVHNSPRKLAPIVNKVKVNRTLDLGKIASVDESHTHLSPRPDLMKMKTDYESFESIAKRNKLNLTQFFNSSLSHRRTGQRLPMSLSTVTIIDEGPEKSLPATQRESPVEYITDISGKKTLSVNAKSKDKLSVGNSMVSQMI